MSEHCLEDKSYKFAIRVVNLYKVLTAQRKEFVMSKQVLRSGTSIGANVSEAKYAHSRADFKAKVKIALKEANETSYWLRLLHDTEYITDVEYENINNDIVELIKILISICKSIG